jgi:hypothetical protein
MLQRAVLIFGWFAIAFGQSPSRAILVNLDTANWTREKGASAGSEGVMIRADQTTGGMDLLVRFPAGHVIAPHWHESNERIFVAEVNSRFVKIPATPFSRRAASLFYRYARSNVCRVLQRPVARSIFPGTVSSIRTRRNRSRTLTSLTSSQVRMSPSPRPSCLNAALGGLASSPVKSPSPISRIDVDSGEFETCPSWGPSVEID